MRKSQDTVFPWILLDEGGYAERDSEPGGAVNHGITQELYRRFCKGTGKPVPEAHDFAPLKALDEAGARDVYRWAVLGPLRFDELPGGIDYAVLDFGVNSGVSGVLKALRKAFALPAQKRSWAMEDELLHALTANDPGEVIDKICKARLAVMKSSKSWIWAERGWVPRVNRVKARAKAIAGVPPDEQDKSNG